MAKDIIELSFPNLAPTGYHITSVETPDYNCIAWAAHDANNWWWPCHFNGYFWPDGVKKAVTVQNFIAAFKLFGFDPCNNAEWESGFEKVAIYVDQNGEPTHMARQLASGTWTSKLGEMEDIEHNHLTGLEGNIYGSVAQILKRPITFSDSQCASKTPEL